MYQNPFSAGTVPQTPLGVKAYNTPRPSSWLMRGKPSLFPSLDAFVIGF